jgi:hypothetical protein
MAPGLPPGQSGPSPWLNARQSMRAHKGRATIARSLARMSTPVRLLICALVAGLAACATAAIQVYSGGPYSNAVMLLIGAIAFVIAWLATKQGDRDSPPWWWWW